ncbi:MAG: RidA family protein [Chloroflexi bacterium]|nr:RidA family protein [Chloroflexota bacterium]
MEKRIVHTAKAPQAQGPYSQGVEGGGYIFAAGQIGVDPHSGELIAGDIATQTRQALNNLSAVLEAGGGSLDRVVKTTVFLTNLDDFAAMNSVYAEFFPADPPARSTVQVTRLPRGGLVEIEAVALRRE